MKRKTLLSTLWIFAVLNYLYCDVLSLMDHNVLSKVLDGNIDGMVMSEGFLLGAAVLMEISISMVLLSRILPYRSNRVANLIAATITTFAQVGSLFVGSRPSMYYLFFSIIEIGATVFIFWTSLKWKNPES